MRITVIGLWHLGVVTACGLSESNTVSGLELHSHQNLDKLRGDVAPLNEPGLSAWMKTRREAGLHYTGNFAGVLSTGTDALWVCEDVPVDADGVPNAAPVIQDIRFCLTYLPPGKLVVLVSQFPVGTCDALQKEFPAHRFVVIPENLRIGRAIEQWRNPGRNIVGVRSDDLVSRGEVQAVYAQLPGELIFMAPRSAEMVKHTLNAWLSLSITFANEIGRVCAAVDANASDVMLGLMSEQRVGRKAYLTPGKPFSGWTLVRDLNTLSTLGAACGLKIIPAIKPANDAHASISGSPVVYAQVGR